MLAGGADEATDVLSRWSDELAKVSDIEANSREV
jgi:hypothetical protein